MPEISTAESPSEKQIVAAVRGMLRGGVSKRALHKCPAILALAVVHDAALSESLSDLAVAAEGIVQQAVARVDREENGPLSTLLALAQGSRNTTLMVRRKRAAEQLNITPGHMRKERERRLLEDLAAEIYGLDSAWRKRHQHRTTPQRDPRKSQPEINWRDRYEAYHRIWTPVNALRNDLIVLLDFIRRDADWPDIADRITTQLWRFTEFSRDLRRFVAEQGGLWLLSDADREIAVSEAVYYIGFETPLGEADASWLRTTLAEIPGEELDGFIDRMLKRKRGKEMIAAWLEWAKTCHCDLEHPDTEHCQIHRWIAACERYTTIIEPDWQEIADYYRTTGIKIEPTDILKLWERYRREQEDQ